MKHDFGFIVVDVLIRWKEKLGNNFQNAFTKSVTMYQQVVLCNGEKETLNEVRTKCCSTCKNYDNRSYKYPINEADLPSSTVSCESPFTFTSYHNSHN